MHCFVERYKKSLATPMDSNKFTQLDMKKKNSDLKMKKPKILTY